ncbi:ABC transporter ATP-binding protein [bacterium]|nr:ABC transporter ATP-binding protein [bacterium]
MSNYITKDKTKTGQSDFQSLKTLFGLAEGHRPKILFALFLMVISYTAAVTSAVTIGKLIEEGIRANNKTAAIQFGLMTLGLELIFIFFHYFGRRMLSYTSLKVIFSVREQLFNKLKTLPMSYFDTQPLGRTVTRLTHDVENIENFFSGSMPRLVGAFLSLIIVSIAMLITNAYLGSILFLSVLPGVLITLVFRKPIRKYQQEFSKGNSAVNARLNELLNGLSVIRAFGLESWSRKHFNVEASKFLESALAVNRINSWARPTVSLLAVMPIFVLVLVGVPMVTAGVLTLGLLVTFLRYCERFYRPVFVISQEIHQLQNAFAYLDRVLVLLFEKEEGSLIVEGSVELERAPMGIAFKECWMKYNESAEWILKGLNLNIHPGETLGLIGRTGSGKTTAVSLISRLYEFQKGSIEINGHSISTLKRDSLRSNIGFISQDVVIFEGSLKDNLSLGKTHDQDTLLEACEQSGLIEIMRRGNLGLESKILDKGANLSVGERQLLALTRIFLDKPDLVILDEATANIDQIVEEKIQRALKIHMKKTTCLIIAHRLNTLDLCDRVAVLKDGKLDSYKHPSELGLFRAVITTDNSKSTPS